MLLCMAITPIEVNGDTLDIIKNEDYIMVRTLIWNNRQIQNKSEVDDTSLTDRIFSDVRYWLDNVSFTNYEGLYKPIAHDTPEEVIDTATKAEAYCYNIILEINNCNTLLAMMSRIKAVLR